MPTPPEKKKKKKRTCIVNFPLTVFQTHKFSVNSGFQNFVLPHFFITFTNRINSTPVMLRDNLPQNKTFRRRENPAGKLIKYKFILNMHKHVDSDMIQLSSS